MTEKEFKKIINQSEEKNSEIISFSIDEIIDELKKHFTSHITIDDYINKTIMAEGQRNIEIVLKFNVDTEQDNIVLKVALNELENSLLYSGLAQNLEKNFSTSMIKITYLDYMINFNLRYQKQNNLTKFSFDVEKNRLKLYEKINNQYTYFKNVQVLSGYFINQDALKNINDDIISILLWYGLQNYPYENKYYSYLNVLGRALDDFTNGKTIQVINQFTDLEINEVEKSNEKYMVIDPLCPFHNLAATCNEQNISEYRKLRKKLTKECEVKEDVKNLFDSNLEIIVDVNPKAKDDDTYMWNYEIVGKNSVGNGGDYSNDTVSLQTAILKATFKALKILVDNQLTKKRIIIKCDYEGVLSDKFLTSDENKSRMKTIKNLIENHKLNVTQD